MYIRVLVHLLIVLLSCLILAESQHGVEKSIVILSDEKELVRSRRFISVVIAGISAAAAAISAGTGLADSVAGSARQTYNVVVNLEVDNVSRWPLTNPVTYIHGGALSLQPRAVLPATEGEMVMRQSYRKVYGSWGTVSWDVNGRTVIVMWSAPSNHRKYSNWLAVGILPTGRHSYGTWEEMYNYASYSQLREYWYSVQTVRYCDRVICISGTMGTTHYPEVHIIVYPKYEDDIAPTLADTYSAYA